MIRKLSLALLFTAALAATPISYDVTIDTSLLTGGGFLDFQFNPGGSPVDPATATISNFSMGGGTLDGAPLNTGGVSANLPGLIVTLLNSLNASYQQVTWGSQVSFRVTFSGTLIEAPDPGGVNGAQFSVSLFDDNEDPILVPALAIDIAPAGGGITPMPFDPTVTINEVPEPSTVLLSLAGLALAALRRRRQR